VRIQVHVLDSAVLSTTRHGCRTATYLPQLVEPFGGTVSYADTGAFTTPAGLNYTLALQAFIGRGANLAFWHYICCGYLAVNFGLHQHANTPPPVDADGRPATTLLPDRHDSYLRGRAALGDSHTQLGYGCLCGVRGTLTPAAAPTDTDKVGVSRAAPPAPPTAHYTISTYRFV